ncbi:MAG: UDP-glucose dehydrogenase family protein [Actinomycetota bacterium]|nr:UDP-glucose/GDP-mannose dehydrogenase family protein [Actinomycetota bacterium]MDQ3217779.1 UDP-glucose/GDP-mannose dehydrogenase family protein [Actinomycetota bacterium]
MKVGVIGAGHVGLVTCGTMAKLGHDVIGNDLDEEKIAMLRRGVPWFYEPGLQELLDETMESGKLSFTTDSAAAISGADVVFICVGTPPRASGEANLIAVEQVARDVARHGRPDVVVVEKSTVPAGTAQRVKRTLARERADFAGSAEVVSNPEFLKEGTAVEDSLHPDRILVGAETSKAYARMRELYGPLLEGGTKIIETDIATAELAKHACNAFLALKISYANALSRLCERSGADVVAVAEVMGADERIGRAFLNAGLGYGGYCFPKDIQAFERLAARVGAEFPLLREVARINDQAVESAANKVLEALWNVEGKKIALLGLAFKPGTDDVRSAPALALARLLLREGAHVVGYDPQGGSNAKAELPELEVCHDMYDALNDAHCMVLCTEWDEFKTLDLEKLHSLMAYPVVVDGRNLFDPQEMKNAGFSYYPTGRPHVV